MSQVTEKINLNTKQLTPVFTVALYNGNLLLFFTTVINAWVSVTVFRKERLRKYFATIIEENEAIKVQTGVYIKFYSHQLMHFFIQLCISLLSYIKIT